MTLNKKTYHFHELAISGYSGCGKTTLITKLIKSLSINSKVFYCKHDAHYFEIDHQGKDSFEAKSAGATGVSIYSKDQWATVQTGSIPFLEKKYLALDYDFALVEGHKHTEIQKIIFLDEKNEILTEYQNKSINNVLAFISPVPREDFIDGKPVFSRDNVKAIQNLILQTFKNELNHFPLNALILVGGKSTRMGQDKGQINYHDDYQSQYLAKILKPHCNQVFFSCRTEQGNQEHLANHPHIYDQFSDIGPLGGILSYFNKHPLSRLLVVACDMPFIDEKSILQLLQEQSSYKMATVFENPDKKWPEPLFAIYHPKSYARFFQLLGIGVTCPMKMLLNSDIQKITPITPNAVMNGNTHEEMQNLKNMIKESVNEKRN